MNRLDWNLLAIAAAGGQPLSPVQLQKALFLFEHAFGTAFEGPGYNFLPYDYGPFSVAVYHDAEHHAAVGNVMIARLPGGWSQYAATQQGLTTAQAVAQRAPQPALTYLREVVAWARSLSFQQLVRAIYDKFPEYRERSVFRY
jgi:hypothetical protein